MTRHPLNKRHIVINISYFRDFVKGNGWKSDRFIPLRKNEKIPLNNKWPLQKLSSEELKKAIKSGNNIGVKLNETDLIVDFDLKNYTGDDPKAYVSSFIKEFGLSDSLIVRTISGGFHIYLKKDPNLKIYRYNKERWADVIEFKTKGSQVLAPGCTINGKTYKTVREGEPKLAPKNLLDLIEKKMTGDGGEVHVDLSTLKEHLSLIKAEDNKDYDTWLKIGQAAHSASSGSDEGLDLWAAWCRSDPDYDTDSCENENRRKWGSFHGGGGINFNYLKKVIKDSGALIPRQKAVDDFSGVEVVECEVVSEDADLCKLEISLERDKQDQIKNTTINAGKVVRFYLRRLGIYFDACDNLIKFKKLPPWSEKNMTWNDRHAKAFHEYIAKNIYDMPETKFQNAILAAMAYDEFQIHPIQEFLNGLTWDGVPRLDTWLSKYTGCENSQYTQEVSRYIALAMVKRAYLPGCKVDYMPILEGKQGSGKSQLCSVLGGVWASDEDPFAIPNPKDRATVLEGKWVLEIPELASFARKDPNHLKAFLTKTHDRFRRAYGREVENLGRGCIFIGTTNDQFYLQDKTGNRRFLPILTGEIDVPGFAKVRDQILAEAVVEFRKYGEELNLMFSREAESIAKVSQEERRVVSAFEEDVVAFIEERNEAGDTFISTDQIKNAMHRSHRNRPISDQTVGRFFEDRHWYKSRSRAGNVRIRGYQKK